MESSPSLLQIPRLRLSRHLQHSPLPLDDDLSRTPIAGPSRLHPLHDENEDAESTPRLTISSSLPSMYVMTEDTPAARLRALLAQVPNASSTSRTQLLHEPPPSLPSDRESDFDPPPKWASSSTSSARESLKSLFTHALRSPGGTPRKDARRNSIDSSEVEDSPRNDRVIQERSRNKGKRMSFSDEELDKSSKRKTPIPTSHAASMEALRNHILSSHASQLDGSMSGASNSSTDTALLREMHGHTASGPGITSTSMQTVQLSAQFQSQSNLLDQDSDMQRAMGTADSFDNMGANQELSLTVSSLAARPRTSLARAGSLTEARPSASASRRSEGPQAGQDGYDSTSNASSATGNVSSVTNTPPRERRDSYHHHRASHSLTGSPLPQEFPRQRYESANSGSSSRSSSRAESNASSNDFRDRMRDTEKEHQHERERAWNRPLSARSRSTSHHTNTVVRSSRTPDKAEADERSVQSGAAEEEEGDLNWVSHYPKLNNRDQDGPSRSQNSQSQSQSNNNNNINTNTNTNINGHTTQAHTRHIRRNASQSSLLSEGSSRPSSPANTSPSHTPKTGHKDEQVRERNWGSRQPKWARTHIHKRAVSPNPPISRSRVRTQSLESDSSAPTMSALTRPPDGHLKSPPSEPEQHSPSPAEHMMSSPALSSLESHEHNEMSTHSVTPLPRSKPVNGHPYDKPALVIPRRLRPDSPLAPDGSTETKGTPPASRLGWYFPRHRPQLPDFESNMSSPERSTSPGHLPTGRTPVSARATHIPVRSPGQVPKVEFKRNGDAKMFTRGHKRATTEFAEANGAVPPKIPIQPEPKLEPQSVSELESFGAKSPQESDENIQDMLTPVTRPVEISSAEKPQTSPPVENSSAHVEHTSIAAAVNSEPSLPSSLSDKAPSFELSTPRGLPELPGPPPSSEDDTGTIDILSTHRRGDGLLDLTTMKTPRPPGAWAATPAPMPARSQTPQPALPSSASVKLLRARSNSLPQPSFTDIQPSMVVPPSALSRAGTLPTRTPAPPGGWFSTPGSLRRKSLMKVRFDNVPSDSAMSDGDASARDEKFKVPLPVANWDVTPLPKSGLNTSESMSEPSFNDVKSSSPAAAPTTPIGLASVDNKEEGASVRNSPPDAANYTSTGLPSRRKPRRSPSVRLVDEYGHAQEDPPTTPRRKDVKERSISMHMPGGGPLKTPRNVSVRMVDAMGHEVEEPSEQNDSEDTVTEVRYSRQEALERMKKAVADLREGLSSVDTSSNVALDDPRLSELYDLSTAARDMRAKLASSLQQAQTAQIKHRYGSLKESMRKSRFLPNFLQEQRMISWNHWLFWGIFFLQFVIFLAMYRMSKIHARHQFLTTYFDPFYADLHLHPTKPEFVYDTNLFSFLRRSSLEPSHLERLGIEGPILHAKRNIADAIAQVQNFIWESWGTSGDDQGRAWPPT
ncbi:hypothetical protein B0F90DRAFT_1924051 [Multifurca ochricompacta]|uniref:Uncharacterized protein n=1 Tax=Multifurca ochricompacta TaxID=376703 RepID=A0AAD4M897_9AGAM|nr:hypothetical protein B0F90DRAFT_1924051 [Multifurca ochricompacta]